MDLKILENKLVSSCLYDNKNIEDIYVGFDNSNWNVNKAPSIYTVEVLDNSYDGKELYSFGGDEVLKVDF